MSEHPPTHPIITLLTDFGTADGYVGVLKGVIANIAPSAKVIDISHGIPPQNIRAAAFLLSESWRYFPAGTIHVAVVDPGVGSTRRGLAAQSGAGHFVGPDNGVLTTAFETGAIIRSLENSDFWLEGVSNTFHGRDIFAPVAANLAAGCDFCRLGPEIDDPVRFSVLKPIADGNAWIGEIVYTDHFGNLVTNFTEEFLRKPEMGPGWAITLEDKSVWPVVTTYSEVPAGNPCAVVGGFQRLELAINGGNASATSGSVIGDQVWLAPGH